MRIRRKIYTRMTSLLDEERARRRQRRLRQVRQQSAEASRMVLRRVEERRRRELDKIALREVERCRGEMLVELATLEEEYQRCLRDIGAGHEGAREAEKQAKWMEEQRKERRRGALARGRAAAAREKERLELEKKAKENRAELRKSALLSEKLRTAERLRQQREKVEAAEMQEGPTSKPKVVLLDRRREMDKDQRGVTVTRIPLSDVANNGLTAAIRQQEEEQRKRRLLPQSPTREESRSREVFFPAKKPAEPSSSSTPSPLDMERVLSTITEELEESQQGLSRSLPEEQEKGLKDEVDLVPVKGPSSETEESGSGGRNGARHGQAVDLTGALSTTMPRSRSVDPPRLDAQDLRDIRELLDRVEKQKRQLDSVSQHVEGRGGGSKNDEADRRFIAQVLDVPETMLKRKEVGMEESDDEEGERRRVTVRIDLEQETSVSRDGQSSIMHVTTSSSSSSSITRERFISRPLVGGREPRRERKLTDFQSIQSLIQELRSTTPSSSSTSTSTSTSTTSPESRAERVRQEKLKKYIEMLLGMKREDISALSVTSSNMTVGSSPLSSHSEEGSSSARSFVASTPTSILSSSDSKTSVGSKTVRFKEDRLDGSYTKETMKSTRRKEVKQKVSRDTSDRRLHRLEVERQRAEIEATTRQSLQHIQQQFEAQKREIETALERRFERQAIKELIITQQSLPSSSTSSSNFSESTTISEGQLSETTVGSGSVLMRQQFLKRSLSEGNVTKSSPPERSSDSSGSSSFLSGDTTGQVGRILEGLQMSWATTMLKRMQVEDGSQQQAAQPESVVMNKSSSSGSSGSMAAARLRAKLSAVQIPRLKPPPSSSTTKSDDTLADPKLQTELQSSSAAAPEEEEEGAAESSDIEKKQRQAEEK